MTYYWVLFAAVALIALTPIWRPGTTRARWLELGVGLALVLFIGFRFYVGGDWITYENIFTEVNQVDLFTALSIADPAYYGLNWIIGWLGGDIWHVNLICAMIFTYGLMRFCATLPYPSVALLAAVPYLVIVVGMGFTRQATAISCLMAAMASYQGRLKPSTIAWFVLALSFHKSMIFGILIFVFSSTRNRTLNLLIGGAVLVLLLGLFVLGNVERLIDVYIETEMQSGGATVRLLLSWMITGVYFLLLDRSGALGPRKKLWRNMGFFSIALIPAFLLSTSSTAVDRVGFVLLPFQVMVFGYLPIIARQRPTLVYPLIGLIVAFNFAVLFTWLFWAENALYWIPYRNVLSEPFLRVF